MTEIDALTANTERHLEYSARIDDTETKRILNQQYLIEKYVTFLIIFLAGMQAIGAAGGLNYMLFPYAIAGYITYWIYSKILKFVLFKPMRAVRLGTCANRMLQTAKTQIDCTKWSTWKTPVPRVIAINPSTRKLFIEGPGTDYYGLTLAPEQILEAKVEREQRIETTTRHDSRVIYSFGSPDFSVLGGGSSRSSSRVIESAYLEISYILDLDSTPHRVVFPFMGQRREADDWALAINHMRTRN